MNYIENLNCKQNNRKIGASYEKLAKTYVEALGYTILKMNYRCKYGEIDIIARDKEYIIFIEVKYRKKTTFGYPRESVNYYKQKHIINVAKYFLYIYKLYNRSCRFDVIEVLEGDITHIKNAFIEGRG